MHFDIDKHTILKVLAGSRSYGTSTPTSDTDYRGIAIPPLKCVVGMSRFDQYERSDPDDVTIYSLQKFFDLSLKCNPNVLEQLFVDEQHIVKTTIYGDKLRQERDLFLSQRAYHTFTGYAMSQLKRIKRHKKWLLDPPKGKPVRADFDLPEHTLIPKDQLGAAQTLMERHLHEHAPFLTEVDNYGREQFWTGLSAVLAQYARSRGIDLTEDEDWHAAAEDVLQETGRNLGFTSDFLTLLAREKSYSTAAREWKQYSNWLRDRNPARAELESRYGYDCKHAMHLVRLMRMGGELLETGQLTVFRPDQEELLAIRNGAWAYEDLIVWAEEYHDTLRDLKNKSSLPREPDFARAEQLLIEFTLDFNMDGVWAPRAEMNPDLKRLV